MLLAISGTLAAGKTEVARYLTFQGFQLIAVKTHHKAPGPSADGELDAHVYEHFDELLDDVTSKWQQNFVISHIDDSAMLHKLQKRPFFLHLSIDAPVFLRYQRYCLKNKDSVETAEAFIAKSDALLFNPLNPLIEINNQAHIKVVNTTASIKSLYIKLSELDVLNPERLRPTWDAYFMRLADLAALRSNCMKRRVGCVIVKDNRVVATGYNGTPRNLTNCNEGGCARCNQGQGSGASLLTCLCLHAEENALLEAGRERTSGDKSILYCNTCPCLTCSIKIVQSGIRQVVYAQSYSMDEQSHRVMSEARIVLRQYVPPKEGIFI
ncbi:hypothetical protein METBIDRAFT_13378 [Metschnikowia bicuspidata var. bicuspidata NRRL YB-4993]|uniref:Deoxycytidylate deaminase n=1 Tax=Metschnikowia bicuspidata var. bicuspidata NRRL YB-4993 TaxID=869754 RepID=A0A1A0H6B9_9ASCO|nr:hypothetical protein METBIDRAFT_13378 [Metschnikowia bicuspidata var. bicuspidata NRRL YB-4993]OBA19634.1 hypothetical protein METBIDRAFT_13378 [Metschnikowia bicuspidata var. bicuspidata NRRL YB-4993]